MHLIAKDILKFHAVIWPALLMAADLPLPKRVFIHGYLLMDEHKMSKSLGNVLDPFAVMDLYGTDALRYYLLREVAFGGDGSISPEGFETRYNTELANEYGNLASRSLAMIGKYRDGVVPEARGAGRARRGVRRPRRRGGRAASTAVDVSARARGDLAAGARAQPLRAGRGAVEAGEGRVEGGASSTRVLYALAEGLRVVSVLLHPCIPEAAEKLLAALGREDRSLDTARLRRRGRRRDASASSASSSRRSSRPRPTRPSEAH